MRCIQAVEESQERPLKLQKSADAEISVEQAAQLKLVTSLFYIRMQLELLKTEIGCLLKGLDVGLKRGRQWMG